MTPQHTFILLIAGLAAITGLALVSLLLTYLSKNKNLATHEETKRQMFGVIKKQFG